MNFEQPWKHRLAISAANGKNARPSRKFLKDWKQISSQRYTNSIVQRVEISNIIAWTEEGDADYGVMIRSHPNSVSEGTWINNNGSGAASQLDEATYLALYLVINRIRFVWWLSEEEDPPGSKYYFSILSETEIMSFRVAMDYGMFASLNFAYQVYNANHAAESKGCEDTSTDKCCMCLFD